MIFDETYRRVMSLILEDKQARRADFVRALSKSMSEADACLAADALMDEIADPAEQKVALFWIQRRKREMANARRRAS